MNFTFGKTEKKQELQLLPGTKKRLGVKTPGENRFLYLGSAIFGATLVAMFALNQYTDNLMSQIDELNNRIVALEEKRDKKAEADLIVTKSYIDSARDLLDNHIYWTAGLNSIVKLLQSGVRFKSFSGDTYVKSVAIKIEVKNFTILARQIAAFLTEPGITKLSMSDIKPQSSGMIETSLTLDIDTVKLLRQ